MCAILGPRMDHRFITLRTIFDRDAILRLAEEPEFVHNISLQAKLTNDPSHDHFLAVFVFEVISQGDGTLLLRVVSTTVTGIQRYTTKRLIFQGIYMADASDTQQIPFETLRAHFREQEQDVRERINASSGPGLPWKKAFPNGAGDSVSPMEFVIDDPDVTALNALFSISDLQEDDDPAGEES